MRNRGGAALACSVSGCVGVWVCEDGLHEHEERAIENECKCNNRSQVSAAKIRNGRIARERRGAKDDEGQRRKEGESGRVVA